HLIGLGLFVVGLLATVPVLVLNRIVGWMRQRDVPSEDPHQLSRRQFLGVAAALAPPVFTFSLSATALAQLNHFRVRRFVIGIPDLSSDLAGTTIAQVSDIHVGRFTSGRVLREMVKVVNELRADLVLLTGDLINDSLADLNEGLDLVRAMQSRF